MQNTVINISISGNLLKEADKLAKSEYRNRSELFREALRNYIRFRSELDDIYSYAQKQAQKKQIDKNQLEQIINEYRKAKN